MKTFAQKAGVLFAHLPRRFVGPWIIIYASKTDLVGIFTGKKFHHTASNCDGSFYLFLKKSHSSCKELEIVICRSCRSYHPSLFFSKLEKRLLSVLHVTRSFVEYFAILLFVSVRSGTKWFTPTPLPSCGGIVVCLKDINLHSTNSYSLLHF